LALATPPTRGQPWLTNEILHLFHFFGLDLDVQDEVGRQHSAALINSVVPGLPEDIAPRLATLAAKLLEVQSDSASTMDGAMSVRTMLRVARRTVAYPEDLGSAVSMNLMTMFMPTQARSMVNTLMKASGLEGEAEDARGQRAEAVLVDEQADGTLDIGGIRYQIVEPANPELVPDIVFFEIPSHTLILRSMLKDYLLGEVSQPTSLHFLCRIFGSVLPLTYEANFVLLTTYLIRRC
jgi:hypothetical protein